MISNRSVARYDRRATNYGAGVLGRWHADIVERTAVLVRTVMPGAGSILDVGCGSGALLRSLGQYAPHMTFVGVDPAPQMLAIAVSQPGSAPTTFALACAEALPCRGATFDVVVSSVSFGHWPDQRSGLSECRRVLVEGGSLVVVDVFARWLNMVSRRGSGSSAHTRRRTTEVLHDSGFQSIHWHDVFGHAIGAVVAR